MVFTALVPNIGRSWARIAADPDVGDRFVRPRPLDHLGDVAGYQEVAVEVSLWNSGGAARGAGLHLLSGDITTIWFVVGGTVASAQGKSMVRPWRVGLLVDTSSRTEVRDAVAMLSSVWGGRFMPILDRNAPIEEIRRQGRVFDVDALYAEDAEGALGDLIREPGWVWQGRGEWGPFVQHKLVRRGLLPVAALLEPGADFVQPQWDAGDRNDLVFAAIWGLTDRIAAVLSPTYDGRGPRSVPLEYAIAEPTVRGRVLGAADLTGLFVRAKTRRYLDWFRGFALLRPDVVDDVVSYWNARTFGTDLIGLPADGPAEVVREMVRRAMQVLVRSADEDAREHPNEVSVWGLGHASPEVRAVLDGVVGEFGLSVAAVESDFLSLRWIFQGLETPFTKTVRVEFRPPEGSVDVPVASLPLVDDSDSYSIGVVAAQVEMHRVEGQDPRFTASVPPYPRHSELLKSAMARSHVDHSRVSSDGQVFGIDARRQDAPYAFAYNLKVFEKLFDEESVTVSQSEVGRFQTRAAEKFGGAFSGFFNHPGVRSAVLLAAGGRDGVALPHLRQVVERDRGDWPGPFTRISPKEYAEQRVNFLLHSGLFVPVLRVHCSHAESSVGRLPMSWGRQ